MQRSIFMKSLWIVLIFGLFLPACRTAAPAEDVPIRELVLNFFATVKATPAEEVRMEIGVSGVDVVPANPDFGGLWELRDADGNVRASGRMHELPEMVGENILFTVEEPLSPGRYELTWGAPAYGGLVKQFEVVAENGRLQLGSHQTEYITTAYPPVMP